MSCSYGQVADMAMDYLHKFRTGLFTAVEAVQSALPGNPVLRELDVGNQVRSLYAQKCNDKNMPSNRWLPLDPA